MDLVERRTLFFWILPNQRVGSVKTLIVWNHKPIVGSKTNWAWNGWRGTKQQPKTQAQAFETQNGKGTFEFSIFFWTKPGPFSGWCNTINTVICGVLFGVWFLVITWKSPLLHKPPTSMNWSSERGLWFMLGLGCAPNNSDNQHHKSPICFVDDTLSWSPRNTYHQDDIAVFLMFLRLSNWFLGWGLGLG